MLKWIPFIGGLIGVMYFIKFLSSPNQTGRKKLLQANPFDPRHYPKTFGANYQSETMRFLAVGLKLGGSTDYRLELGPDYLEYQCGLAPPFVIEREKVAGWKIVKYWGSPNSIERRLELMTIRFKSGGHLDFFLPRNADEYFYAWFYQMPEIR